MDEPTSQPRPVGERLWVVEAPLRFLGVNVGRRMGVARLATGDLFVHSPAPLTDELRAGLEMLGPIRFVVPASNLHGHLFMEQYAAAGAQLFAAPGLPRRRADLEFAGELGDSPDPRWAGDIDQVLFRGHRLWHEVLFLHRPSRTLIVGDLVWHVTPSMPFSARLWAGWRTGVRPTPGFRLGIRDRTAARESLERVLEWEFDQMLIGHGEPLYRGGPEALRQAYRRILGA